MDVWLITIGEPLPLPGHDVRLLRTGRLARHLAARGHRVTWWTSAFDHFTKSRFPVAGSVLRLAPNLELIFLDGAPYRRNVSLARLVNHWQVARAFRAKARTQPRADVILASLPTIELAYEATRIGGRTGTPVVLDVRDLWPDAFLSVLPPAARTLGRFLLASYVRKAREALSVADVLIATSAGYLEWALRYAGRPRQPADAVIPLGYEPLDDADSAPGRDREALLALGINPSHKICWFVGTFGRTYDLRPVIEAARALWRAGYQDVQFVLSGAGELDTTWRRLAAGAPNVVFTGWISRTQIRALMRSAYLGLAAYAVDAPQGLPNKLFEYMCAGLPIVSSLQGEAENLLRDLECGLTYPPGDSAALGRAVARLLEEPDLHARMVQRARLAYERYFAASRIDAEFAALLERLAAPRGSREQASTERLRGKPWG